MCDYASQMQLTKTLDLKTACYKNATPNPSLRFLYIQSSVFSQNMLLYILDLFITLVVETDSRFAHAEVENPGIHIVLYFTIVKQLPYVVL